MSEENRNLKRAGWGCVVGCSLLGGSITPLARNTSSLSAMAGSSLAMADKLSNGSLNGWGDGKRGQTQTVMHLGTIKARSSLANQPIFFLRGGAKEEG